MKKIAMRATKKEFKGIKSKLKKAGLIITCISDFDTVPYLVNNWDFNKEISNVVKYHDIENDYEIHETFNAKIFLEACGIEFDEYKITKEQILEIEQWGNKSDAKKVREWYPECFKKELIVGVWYKNSIDSLLYCKNIEYDGCISGYGFNQFGQWVDDYVIIPEYTEATPKEVEEALVNYAKTRYKKGDRIKYNGFEGTIVGEIYWADGSMLVSVPCDKKSTKRPNENFPLMKDGVWSEILPPKKKMTISEIEEKLGYEIEIV